MDFAVPELTLFTTGMALAGFTPTAVELAFASIVIGGAATLARR